MADFFPSSLIESLEPRLAPAGVTPANVVNLSTAGGTLTITGTADSEHITITDNPATGQWFIAASALLPDTVFKLNGVAVADPSDIKIAAQNSIKATMGDGDDQIDLLASVNGMIVNGTVNLAMGKGADLVNFGDTSHETMVFKGAVTVDLGDGLNAFNLKVDALFANTVSIKGGAQRDVIAFLDGSGDGGSTIHTFQKGLAVDLGAGSDVFDLGSDVFRVTGGALTVKGAGQAGETQAINLSPYEGWADGAVTVTVAAGNSGINIGRDGSAEFHFGAGLTVTTGNGNDGLLIHGNITVAGALTADLKDGDNVTGVRDEAFFKAGSFTLKGGGQGDILSFDKNSATIITGALTTSLGSGLNAVAAFSEDSGGQRLTVGSLSQTGTTGNDAFFFESGYLTVLGNASFALGAGNNVFLVSDSAIAYFGGNVSVVATIGDDTAGFASTAVTVMGNVTMNLGNGTNSAGIGGRVDISGGVSVSGGIDDDTLEIFGDYVRIGRALQMSPGDAGVKNTLDVYADVSVFGSLSYTGGKGNDTVLLGDFGSSTSILGNAVVSMGAGFSDMKLHQAAFHGTLNVTSASTADQKDELDLAGSLLFSAVTLNLGAGTSLVTVDDNVFCDNFTANLGAGTDVIKLDTDAAHTGSNNWYGVVKINLGAGDDIINLGGAGAETVNFFGKAISIDGGAGADTLTDTGNTYLVGTGPVKTSVP